MDEVLGTCPSSAEMDAFNSALTITFDGDPTAPTLLCTAAAGSADLTLFKKNVYQSLRVMRLLNFDAPLPWTPRPLYEWFTAAIHGIHFRTDTTFSYCCEAGGIIVIPASPSLVIAQNYGFMNDIDYFIQLMIHEARHNEGYVHTCGGQDQTIAELGARGIEYYYFEWLALHSMSFLDATTAPAGTYRTAELSNAAYWRDAALFCQHPTLFAAPTSLTFPSQAIGAASATFTVAITAGTATNVSVSSATLAGLDAADFVIVGNTCVPATLPFSCIVQLTFVPLSAGSKSANLAVQWTGGTVTIPVAGTGLSSPLPPPNTIRQLMRPARPPKSS